MDESEVFQQQLKITKELLQRANRQEVDRRDLLQLRFREAEEKIYEQGDIRALYNSSQECKQAANDLIASLIDVGMVFSHDGRYIVVSTVDRDQLMVYDVTSPRHEYRMAVNSLYSAPIVIDLIEDKKLRRKVERLVVKIRTEGWGDKKI